MEEFYFNMDATGGDIDSQETPPVNVTPVELKDTDIAEVAVKFSGLRPDGSPKAIANYCAYDQDSPEDDFDRNLIGDIECNRVELTLDRMTGFYTLDFVFDSPNNKSLKLFWSRLQRHKMNETYESDKLWIFFIKLVQNTSNGELGDRVLFSANILNPLAFFLIRTVPEEEAKDYLVDTGVYCGGNTVRLLLHRDLVTFQYEEIDTDEWGVDTDNEEFSESGDDF